MGEANVWQPKSIVSVNANSTVVPEYFTAEQNQTYFALTSFVYTMGVHTLWVYKNGELLTEGLDWTEITEDSFSLTAENRCDAGDIVLAQGFTAISASTNNILAQAQAAADAAAASANYVGDWAGAGVKGSSYSYDGATWLCLQDNTVTPVDDDINWRKVITITETLAAETPVAKQAEIQHTGYDVYPDTRTETASIAPPTNEVPAGTTALRDAINNAIYTMAPVATGTITAVDYSTGTATIGGTGVVLTKYRSVPFSNIADVKTNGTGGTDGEKINVLEYSSAFGCKLSLHREVAEDNAGLAGTDWNDNGAIGNKLICFGPNGEAWCIHGKNAFCPRLGITDEVGLSAAIAYVAAQKSTLTGFNDYLLSANGEVCLGGLEITVTTEPVHIPDTMNGVIISQGMIIADSGYTGTSLIEANSPDKWTTSICIKNVILSGNHVTGCIEVTRGHNWHFNTCRFHGYATFGFRNNSQGTSNSMQDCDLYEYHQGEPNFDNPAFYTGTGIQQFTSDLKVTGCFMGFALHGVYTTGGNFQMSNCHQYGITGWAIRDSSAQNSYDNIILDEPCKVLFDGPTPGYGTRLTNIKFIWAAPSAGAMITYTPNSAIELSGVICTNSAFLTDGYSGYGAISLTLTSIVFGESDIISSAAYFNESMVGGTIVGTAGGVARIIDYTSPTSVHVYLIEAFPASAVSAGQWTHKVTPFYANPLSFGANPSQITIKDNFFRNDTVQAMTSTPNKIQMITAQENFEIEFGRWLILPQLKYAWPVQIEGTTTTNLSMKILYITGSIVGVDFSGVFTGNVGLKAEMDDGLN